jgi:hypothetical protein
MKDIQITVEKKSEKLEFASKIRGLEIGESIELPKTHKSTIETTIQRIRTENSYGFTRKTFQDLGIIKVTRIS